MKTKHSKYILCSHTNLPLHKIYVDAQGDCQPIYRKGQDNSYEGAYFMNSKVLIG